MHDMMEDMFPRKFPKQQQKLWSLGHQAHTNEGQYKGRIIIITNYCNE